MTGALFLCLVLATALMAAAARGDLWLDEIWSLAFARDAATPLEILTRFRHDNNHILNTLFLRLIGEQSHFWVYRSFSVVSGVVSLVLLVVLSRRRGAFESVCVALLAGFSYPLVLYFSEARGYGPAMLCGLLAFYGLQRCEESPTPRNLSLFWAAVVCGILAHLTFVIVVIALVSSTAVRELRSPSSLGRGARRLLQLHLLPLSVLAAFYLGYVRLMEFGGGNPFSYWEVTSRAACLLMGLPLDEPFRWVAVGAFSLCLVAGTRLLAKGRDAQWPFYPVVLVAAPALVIIVTQPRILYFRYFILCFPFFYLLLAAVLGALYRSGSRGARVAAVVLVGLVVAGQARRDLSLLEYGRGDYGSALAYITSHAPEGARRIGSSHDFRNKVVLSFYVPRLRDRAGIRYVDREHWADDPPDWFLKHSQDPAYAPPQRFSLPGVGAYTLERRYPFSGDSGWSWFLYRRDPSGERVK